MQLADCILQSEAQSSRAFILGDDAAHNILGFINVLLVEEPGLSLEHTNANDLVAVINKLSQKPLQRIVGVGVLVDADHECSRATSGLITLVSHVQGQ